MSPIDGVTSKALSDLTSIHLLRALLRETSYLPDSISRIYFRKHVLSRFKAQQPVTKALVRSHLAPKEDYHRRRHIRVIKQRTVEQQRKARKGLSVLRRANNGDLLCLEKVLGHAYGRIGMRRYELLRSLLVPEPLATSADVEAMRKNLEPEAPLQRLYHSNARYLSFFDTPSPSKQSNDEIDIPISSRYPRLREVLLSQKAAKPNNNNLKTSITAPVTNVWGRSMPVKRAKNIVRRWYKIMMGRLLPPLPTHEWELLKGLSGGSIKWDDLIPRRPIGSQRDEETHQSDDDQTKTKILEGLLLRGPGSIAPPSNTTKYQPHTLTPRFMRRLYTKIFLQTCKLTFDPTRNTWRAEWGKVNKWKAPTLNEATDNLLFSGGVTEKGKTIKSQSAAD